MDFFKQFYDILVEKIPWPIAFGLGLLFGVIRVTRKATKFEERMNRLEEDSKLIKDTMYQDRGGLNLMSVEMHKDICEANKELIAAIVTPLRSDISDIKKMLDRRAFPRGED